MYLDEAVLFVVLFCQRNLSFQFVARDLRGLHTDIFQIWPIIIRSYFADTCEMY